MPPPERRALQDAYRLLYRSGLAVKRAVERIEAEVDKCAPVLALIDFIAGATRHGICGAPRETAAPEEVSS